MNTDIYVTGRVVHSHLLKFFPTHIDSLCGRGLPYPTDTIGLPNIGLMLAHRLRHWTNINTTLCQRIVFAAPG